MPQDLLHRLRFQLSQMLDERRALDGLLGLPALACLMLLAFIAINSRSAMSVESLDALESAAKTQLENQRYVEARILARRLAQYPSENLKATLIEAKALRGMGKGNEASRLLSRVAPLTQPGYAAAHVVQAATLLAQEKPDPESALRHLEHALHAEPTNPDALELAARFAAGQKRWDTVLKYLNQMAVDERADLLLMKATALQMSGLQEESIRCARQAEEELREMLKSIGQGTDRIRYSIAVSLSLQRRFEHALQWMMEQTAGKPSKEDRQVMAGIYLSWSRDVKNQSTPDRAQVLKLLENGIQISPESQDVIMAFLDECGQFEGSDEERQRHVEKVLGEGGIATSFMHYYLGVQDWKKGKRESARSHFELASSLNPNFKLISNNLAMAIASVSSNQDELEKALTMMDELLDQEPNNPFYLDTRAHVFTKLGRWKEAVRDFERALPNARSKQSTHAKLAELYQQMGMSELSKQHHTASLAAVTTAGVGLK